MANKTSLGERMKGYEAVSATVLMRRSPVIIRLDGKAFHTFTEGMRKPYDEVLANAMHKTMQYLCENIQGCVFGYTQSDEITLVLADYFKTDTSPWFDYKVQKMCSVAASVATFAFVRFFTHEAESFGLRSRCALEYYDSSSPEVEAEYKQYRLYLDKIVKGVFFDARCFNVPLDDVTNNILWRQTDATRNSIQAAAQSVFSPKELHCKDQKAMQEMLFTQKGINWNDYPVWFKRGCACRKVPCLKETPSGEVVNTTKWVVDYNMPIITEDRNYVESIIQPCVQSTTTKETCLTLPVM